MYAFPFGAPVPLDLVWASGVGVEVVAGAAGIVCLQLIRIALHTGIRRVAPSGAEVANSVRRKAMPRIAG